MKTPCAPWAVKNCTAHHGLIACNTSGSWVMLSTPSAASARNHMPVTGPNTLPTFSVPNRWLANSATSTSTVNGTIQLLNCGATTSRPSSADSTEIAGVITPSPKNSAGSEEHTSELQSLMRISYAVFCLKKTKIQTQHKRKKV